jgi:hypothetical protein
MSYRVSTAPDSCNSSAGTASFGGDEGLPVTKGNGVKPSGALAADHGNNNFKVVCNPFMAVWMPGIRRLRLSVEICYGGVE